MMKKVAWEADYYRKYSMGSIVMYQGYIGIIEKLARPDQVSVIQFWMPVKRSWNGGSLLQARITEVIGHVDDIGGKPEKMPWLK